MACFVKEGEEENEKDALRHHQELPVRHVDQDQRADRDHKSPMSRKMQ